MHFWKMNGAGNDFILINNMEEHLPPECFSRLAQVLCRRRMSIGADGLMVVDTPRQGGDFRMRFYNSDGSPGEMCGNGARCICRYGYETGLSGQCQTVETTAGMITGQRIDRRNYRIRLNDPSVIRLNVPVEVAGVSYSVSYLELGSPGLPHAVLPCRDLLHADEGELLALGRALRHHPAFPKGANVNFCQVVGEDHFLVRTYERGVEDFTLACGTGTGCTAAVLTLQGRISGHRVQADTAGGTLWMDVRREGSSIRELLLTGPTNLVCQGEITDEELRLQA